MFLTFILPHILAHSFMSTFTWEKYGVCHLQGLQGPAADHFPQSSGVPIGCRASDAQSTWHSTSDDTGGWRAFLVSIAAASSLAQLRHSWNCTGKWITEMVQNEITLTDELLDRLWALLPVICLGLSLSIFFSPTKTLMTAYACNSLKTNIADFMLFMQLCTFHIFSWTCWEFCYGCFELSPHQAGPWSSLMESAMKNKLENYVKCWSPQE